MRTRKTHKYTWLSGLIGICMAWSAGAAFSQEENETADSDDSKVETPDYFDEDLFGTAEEGGEDDDEEGTGEEPSSYNEESLDFFDRLKIGPAGEEDEDVPSIAGEDIDSLPTVQSRDALKDRDYSSYWDTAVFQALDKVTARIRIIEAPLEEPVVFERFEIIVRQCNKRPPEETPNTTAFVEVDELTLTGEREDIFTGWMFASSPGLNAVEHPVYDVWLIDCKRVAPLTVDIAPEIEELSDPETSEAENQSEAEGEISIELAPSE